MEGFNTYWEKIARKRRKSWDAKLARRVAHHTDIDTLRKDVFKPFNQMPGFDKNGFKSYLETHYTQKNPLAEWQQGCFSFSEKGLKDALLKQGCNLGKYKMKKDHVVVEDGYRHATDLDTLTITLGAATMVIKRYFNRAVPFGYYEITPCTILDDNCPMLLEETGFYTLDIATFLMEMDAEVSLREEELMYYVKGLKLSSMEGLTADDIECELWDAEKIPATVKSLIKRYPYCSMDSVLESAIKPWMTAVKVLMENTTQADLSRNDQIFAPWLMTWGRYVVPPADYVKNVLRPYLEAQGLQDAKAYVPYLGHVGRIAIEYHGAKLLLKSGRLIDGHEYECYFYPYTEETVERLDSSEMFLIRKLSLNALAKLVKLMPKYKDRIDNLKAKVIESYKSIKGE